MKYPGTAKEDWEESDVENELLDLEKENFLKGDTVNINSSSVC